VLRLPIGIILALALPTGQAVAAWLPDGVPVCTYPPCQEANPVIAPDSAGGVFVVWQDQRSDPAPGIYAQHLTSGGDVAPGWPTGGLAVSAVSGAYGSAPAVIADGQGGFFTSWTDFRNNAVSQGDIYAQHVRGDGTLAPGWTVNGVPVTQEPGLDNGSGTLALDGIGGVFVAWVNPSTNTVSPPYTVWVQHLSASGAPAAGWPSDGLVACTQPSIPTSIMADGAGGAVVAWTDWRRGGHVYDDTYDAYGLRLTASGAIAPGWMTNGNLLATGQWKPILLSDGTGGFFMASASPSLSVFFDANLYLQRFAMDGVPAPGWPAGGVVVCSAPGDRTGVMAVPDGFGGVLLDWYDYRLPGDDVYASRVLPSGVLAPGWPANGLRVSDPGQPNEFNFGLAPDGLGGAYISWQNERDFGTPDFIQHLTADGLVAPGWPPYGFQLASTCSQFTPQLVPDGAGGAIAVWEEADGICSRNGLFAQRYAPEGPIPTPTLLSLATVDVNDGRVQLDWFATDGRGLDATVYRRTQSSDWLALANVHADGTGHLLYEDAAVAPGERYAYRLGYLAGGAEQLTAETWVDVPALRLALEGLRPNPAVGELVASFTLPSGAPAQLQVLDVTGRAWLAREVGSLGAGNHLVRLTEAGSVPAGIYWLRLTQGGRSLLARSVVIR
jgi:hypothetical protein